MRLFKRRSRFIDKFLKPQKKITKKLLKEYDKYHIKVLLSKKGYTEEKLSEMLDKVTESERKEMYIRMEKINQGRAGYNICEMIRSKIEELLEQDNFKNLLKKSGMEWYDLFEHSLKQLKFDMISSKRMDVLNKNGFRKN